MIGASIARVGIIEKRAGKQPESLKIFGVTGE
jgi:hypothetical protein